MYGYIYKTTNLINGKIYIGKHKGEFTNTYLGSGKYLRNAINKYGLDNFLVELVEYCDNLDIQNEREKYWIEYYRNTNVDMYNIANGGDGGDTFCALNDADRQIRISRLKKNSHFVTCDKEQMQQYNKKAWENRRKNGNDTFSDKSREKMRLSHLGKKPSAENIAKRVKTREGYNHTEETKRKISESNKGKKRSIITKQNMSNSRKGKCCGEQNPFYGKTHTSEVKQLIGSYNSERFKNRIWINNGIENKRIIDTDLDKYLKLGYTKGRIKWKV